MIIGVPVFILGSTFKVTIKLNISVEFLFDKRSVIVSFLSFVSRKITELYVRKNDLEISMPVMSVSLP